MTKEPFENAFKDLRDLAGGKRKQAKLIADLNKQFIMDLSEAYTAGLVSLPEDLHRRLFLLPFNNSLTDPFPAGRDIKYTDDEKKAFVQRTHELRNTGLPIKKAISEAAVELFDDISKRPNSGRYQVWMEEFELPYVKA